MENKWQLIRHILIIQFIQQSFVLCGTLILKLEETEEAKYPDWEGKNHPADIVLRPARRKLSEDIKALQKEYAYLFMKDVPDGKDDQG